MNSLWSDVDMSTNFNGKICRENDTGASRSLYMEYLVYNKYVEELTNRLLIPPRLRSKTMFAIFCTAAKVRVCG